MKRALATLALLALVGIAAAADKPNFSGTWKMNPAKSAYGQIPPPESFTRNIEHAEPSISIAEEQTGPGSQPPSKRAMKTDGQPVMNEINNIPVKLTATWDGAALMANTNVESMGVTFKDKMSLSTDGKELTSVVQIESTAGSIELKIVFDKQ